MIEVRITYYTGVCQFHDGEACPCFADDGACEDYARLPRAATSLMGLRDMVSCGYLCPLERTEVKTVETFDLLKGNEYGYVVLGQTRYELQDVILLQVDYGCGMETEWEDYTKWADRVRERRSRDEFRKNVADMVKEVTKQ
jgi:hypothetical protein